MRRLSIRWRLALWNTLALAAMLVVLGTLVYGLLRRALYRQTDLALAARFQELLRDRRMPADHRARLRHWIEEFDEHVNVFCVVYDEEGNVFDRTERLAEKSLPPVPSADLEPRFDSLSLPSLGRQRLLIRRLPIGAQEFCVILMASLEEVDRQLAQVLTVLLTALPIALVVACGVGYLLARRSLAPVKQLGEMTDRITAQSLDRRLPVPNPDDELGRLAGTINEMIGRLERSFAEVRRFTADASHELRTPIAVIRSEAEVVLAKAESGPECRAVLGSILEECQRLTHLTEQLLTLAREDAGVTAVSRKPLDLCGLAAQAVETMRPLAEAKEQALSIQCAGEVRVLGEPERLRQVFYNLLDNAIKYMPAGGQIEVSVEAWDREAIVTVRDSGIGIAAEHLPHVFDRFYRVDKARSRAEGGAGLGLAICRSIVRAHEGTIDIHSAVGQGTTIIVTLPVAGPEAG